MNKIIGIIIGVLIVGFFINSYINKKAEQSTENEKQERTERDTRKEEILIQVENSVTEHNAIVGWENELIDSTGHRMGSIFTIELEDIWLNDKPILFYGTIKDISSLNNEEALVDVDIDTYSQSNFILYSDLSLRLTADIETIRNFLEKNPQLKQDYYLDRYVAVVATISSIGSKTVISAENDYDDIYIEETEVKVGNGRLLDMIYVGDFLAF